MTIIQKYNYFCNKREEEQLERYLKPTTSLISFANNDYLGLRNHQRLKSAAIHCLETLGVGAGASRLVDGNFEIHEVLEAALAEAKGTETALLFASGYQANLSVLSALLDSSVLGEKPLVFTDKLIHASLHVGCQLAGVRQIRFRHLDLDHLEYCLKAHVNSSQPKFVVTESVFSMDGDVTPLAALVALCKKYQAFLYLDEAHAMGMFGKKGYGFASDFPGEIPLVMGTLSKAVGCFGGYVACSHALKRYLINRCGGVIYTTALPLPIAAAALEAVKIIPSLDKEREHVLQLASWFQEQLTGQQASSQIVPFLCGAPERALKLQQKLEDAGFFVPAIRPPTVPRGESRLRLSLTAKHSWADVQRVLEIMRT